MAQIDFSALAGAFNGFAVNNLDHKTKLSSSAAHYSWETTGGYRFTALSADNDITATGSAPTGGSVDAINVTFGNDPAFSITGLDAPLTSLVDVASADNSLAKFWKAVLAGETTFVMPSLPGINVFVVGDLTTLGAGQTAKGANDRFLGNHIAASHGVYGDALTVAATATLTGGNDLFQGVVGSIVGDVGGGGTNLGTVHGGDDTILATGTPAAATLNFDEISGDVEANRGTVFGGNDRVELTDINKVNIIVGDVLYHDAVSVVGGDDVFSIRKTAGFDQATTFSFIAGDVYTSAVGANLAGGDDVLTVKDATGSVLSGDIVTAYANVDGGDDTIVVGSSAPLYGGSPAVAPAIPTINYLNGDAHGITSGATLNGGNDTITIGNAIVATVVVGDARTGNGAVHNGGDDKIGFSWTQVNIAAPMFLGSGDFDGINNGSATGGDDTLSVNHTSSIAAASASLFGDARNFYGTDNFVGGNDVIVVNSNRTDGSNLLVGDVLDVNTPGTFQGGNDTITGSNGADQIFGDADTVVAAAYVGGNDILNGRGGNDTIDGGRGNDTAVYSSLAQSVFVNLNGIAGSAADPADWVEAIGQGSDQLIDIENIIGSSLDDTIIGNAVANRLSGGAGNDRLDGGAGNDTLTGGAGNDKLTGGAGDDTYVLENGSDSVTDTGGTADTITSTISRSLAGYSTIERLTLTGNASINGSGNSLANIITGNAGNNVLNGGAGADTLIGGAGNDTYALADGYDVVTDTGGTADTITSTISRSLSGHTTIERLTLLGTANINGYGNGLANVITGNTGNNVLDGGAGTDTLVGGAGNDTYVLADGNDVVVDASGAADTITSTISRSLGNYAAIEKLTLLGTAAINGTGNGLNNIITGNGANNVLNGGLGKDVLTGGAGNDSFRFDTALSAANVDRITDFSAPQDTIVLENAVFTGLAAGTLAASAFVKNTTGLAADANDRIIYETDTGRLFYDSNGNAAGGSVHFATLSGNLALTNTDFMVI